jgi:hypothetical protein
MEGGGMTRADELAKLDALRQSGALTQAEFQAEKARLLAADEATQPSAGPVPSVTSSSARPDAKAGAWIALIGGALLAMSSLLPWFTGSVLGASVSRNGMQLGQGGSFSIDGLLTLLLGLGIVVIGISRLANFPVPSWMQRSPIVAGLVAVLLVALDIPGINHLVNQVRNASSLATASIGFGVYLAIVGGVIAALGGMALRPMASEVVVAGTGECEKCLNKLDFKDGKYAEVCRFCSTRQSATAPKVPPYQCPKCSLFVDPGVPVCPHCKEPWPGAASIIAPAS